MALAPLLCGMLDPPQPAAADEAASFAPAAFVQPAPPWPAVLGGALRADEVIGPGVTHERWRLATALGPLELSILRIDLRNPNVSFAAVTHHDAIIGAGEALSSMADRLRAEAGINADYFDIGGSGTPLNIVMSNGMVQHQSNGKAAFAVGPNNAVTMGPVSVRAHVTAADGSDSSIDSINDWSGSTRLALLTARLGATEAGGASEVTLTPLDAGGHYRVASVAAAPTDLLPLGERDYAIAARGAAADDLVQRFHPGDTVTLSFEATPPLSSLLIAVGGGPLLVRDGSYYEDPDAPAPQERNVRYPLTGAGLTPDGSRLLLVTVDGRAPGRSVGVTRPMFASLLIALGATTGMAFDSGGSTELVVRHLGDDKVSVANVPSDRRERSIADAVLVMNTAPPGRAVQLVLHAPARAVLVGNHLALRATAIDANDQPVAVDAPAIAFTSEPASIFDITPGGRATAVRPGRATLRATGAGIAGSLDVTAVGAIAKLAISGYSRGLAAGSRTRLQAVATDAQGTPVAVDDQNVKWFASGDGGRVEQDGTFVASLRAARATLTAQAGGALAQQVLLVGEHLQVVQAAPQSGSRPKQWRYAATPSELAAGLDNAPAPDNAAAMHLTFDFSSATGTRAAYAESGVAFPGEPLAIALDVFGDGSGAWLRGAYKNGDGIVDTVTLARHVDWKGWRSLRVAIPVQARWPITWTRLYVVESSKDAHEAGDVWLRNFGAWYAGP